MKNNGLQPPWLGNDLKFDLKMKLTVLFVFVSFFCLQANTGYSQPAKLTLHMENARVEAVLDEIEAETGFLFVYKMKEVDLDRKVTLKVKRKKITEVLNRLFQGTNTDYEIIKKQIVLTRAKDNNDGGQSIITQDPIRVTGKVTDEAGLPLAGVTVRISGTNTGVATDFDGNYTITVPNDESVLVFTSIGFTTQEITVGNQTTINVTLKEAVNELDEVVINAGYYITSKREATGNISQITAQEIEKQPVANPLQALQGRTAGVYIQQQTGLPGGGLSIQIRGLNSIRRGNDDFASQPFYLVDGVPFTSTSIAGELGGILSDNVNPLSIINPSNIESIEILKDADATAIYGSRGANGVVLITTKKGKPGKSKIIINHSSAFSQVGNKMDLLNTEQYLEMRNEAFANGGATPTEANAPDLLFWDPNTETDWQEKLLGGSSYTTNTTASISGGTNNTQYLFSGTYYNEGTVFPGDFNFNRVSGLLNLQHKSTDNKFNFNVSVNYSTANNTLPQSDLTDDAVTLSPNAPALYDENGAINWENNTFFNPIAAFQEKKYESRMSTINVNTFLSYEILPNLKLSASLGYSDTRLDEVSTVPKSVGRPDIRDFVLARLNLGNNQSRTSIIEPQLNYTKDIGGGNLKVLVGATYQETIREGETIQAVGFPSDALINNQAAAEFMFIDPIYSQYRYNAIFGRLNYNWNDRYIVNLTARRDGSSRFGPGKQFANFGAVGVAWVFTNEAFFANKAVMSFGKLRASYGSTGNDRIGDYEYLNTYRITRNNYAGDIGLIPTRLPNDDYSWETNKKLELGLEIGLLDDRVLFSSSFYQNRTSDQLVGRPLPRITGERRIQFNLPALIENKGWEFELNTINILSSKFEWKTGINLTIPRNTILEFDDIEETGFSNLYTIGESIFVKKLLNVIGVDAETGLYSFQDVDGNGRVDTSTASFDRVFGKEVTQDYFGGIQNTIKYKGIELGFLFQYVKQTGFNYIRSFTNAPGRLSNQPTVVLNRWQQPGDATDVQQFSTSNTVARNYRNFRSHSGGTIGDASFIRLKNTSLSYTLPQNIINTLNLQNFRVYLQGQNLFTITNYLGLDPESQSSVRLPPLRTISFGLQLSF